MHRNTTKSEITAFRILLKIYVYSALIAGIITIINMKCYGGMGNMQIKLNRVQLLLLLGIYILPFFCVIPLYHWMQRVNVVVAGNELKLNFDKKKIHYVMLVLLLAELIFLRKTGVGILEQRNTSKFSFIFNFFKIEKFFEMYYVLARNTKKPLYWINVAIFIWYRFSAGGTSILLFVFFVEIYFFMKYKKCWINQIAKKISGFVVLSAIFIGSYLYKFLYPYKFLVRIGIAFQITYSDAVGKLLGRLSYFSNTILAVQNHAKIAQLYQLQGKWDAEIANILKSMIPSFIMHDKSFRPLSNLIWQSESANIADNVGTTWNVFVYFYNLMESSFACFVFVIIIEMVVLFFTIWLLKAFDNENHDANLLLFYFALQVMMGGTLTNLFSYNYLGCIYPIVFFLIFGVIKVRIYFHTRRGMFFIKRDEISR